MIVFACKNHHAVVQHTKARFLWLVAAHEDIGIEQSRERRERRFRLVSTPDEGVRRSMLREIFRGRSSREHGWVKCAKLERARKRVREKDSVRSSPG